jgi:hypothetical protein
LNLLLLLLLLLLWLLLHSDEEFERDTKKITLSQRLGNI